MTGVAASEASLASPEHQDCASEASSAPVLSFASAASEEEVAAIVAVLAALGSGATPPAAPRSEWRSPARRLRSTASSHPIPGRGAWRASALPR
ncbi:acyl-CoA carboxylase subunit epsilon [Nocardioides albidus]|uniref:Acyl-CoA carboxylase subunit epsilon n=1 Tax=Nocardioides albidus TaxID=1517589 RepID=A0A5C4VK15_9ACTN|nr:acyl-CoA carboxylase subunit epsilon [Nocardioides albidus]